MKLNWKKTVFNIKKSAFKKPAYLINKISGMRQNKSLVRIAGLCFATSLYVHKHCLMDYSHVSNAQDQGNNDVKQEKAVIVKDEVKDIILTTVFGDGVLWMLWDSKNTEYHAIILEILNDPQNDPSIDYERFYRMIYDSFNSWVAKNPYENKIEALALKKHKDSVAYKGIMKELALHPGLLNNYTSLELLDILPALYAETYSSPEAYEKYTVAQKIALLDFDNISQDILQLIEQDKELLYHVVAEYLSKLAHGTSSPEKKIEHSRKFWESIFSGISLEELYDIEDCVQRTKIDPEVALKIYTIKKFYKNLQMQQPPDKVKQDAAETFEYNKEYDLLFHMHTGRLLETYRFLNFLQKYNITAPTWIDIASSDGILDTCSTVKTVFIDQQKISTELQQVGALGHELGHIVSGDGLIKNMIQYEKYTDEEKSSYSHINEYAADRFSCLQSNQACYGLIEYFEQDIAKNDKRSYTDGLTHPSHISRIKKMKKIVEEKEKVKQGLCKNPFYKQLGTQEWFKCKVLAEQHVFEDFKNKNI